ncbi:hypothetical protein H8S90_21330 [Olivibacter sp. SDN3]|uniref:hypothetical protein n=1 Tax=Olivibacter sp. SDN3 TaxID=2764720 RepID=UPI0016514EF9|nr:hypothetical protein [Olivibacter sp. SDN3]QNL49255.1 hypothetical protein H8S90_21330 [Olivibacter sp. SDN3]
MKLSREHYETLIGLSSRGDYKSFNPSVIEHLDKEGLVEIIRIEQQSEPYRVLVTKAGNEAIQDYENKSDQ